MDFFQPTCRPSYNNTARKEANAHPLNYFLRVPTVNSVTYGERAFSFFAPILWNSLAGSVKNTTSLLSYKFALKTFLFREFFLKIILRGTVPRFHATQFLINYFIYFIYYCYKKHFVGFNQFIFF